VHPVLRLVEDDRGRGFEDLVGDLERLQVALAVDLPPDTGVRVVLGRQAVQELDVRVAVLGQ
jgi:hypothetical protein